MAEPLNLLVIMSDDQGAWAMGCAGTPELHTPNLDRLAATGIRFDNFFCASPVCSPARASFLTGRIPSAHGVHDWLKSGNIEVEAGVTWSGADRPIGYLDGLTGFTDLLADAGYRAGMCGKWHMGDSARPQHGHTWWCTHSLGGDNYTKWYGFDQDATLTRHDEYVTDYFADRALAFLGEHGGAERPWCLSLHFTAPHSPWDRANHPAALWDKYHAMAIDSVPFEPKHPWSSDNVTPERRQNQLAGYFAATEAMDAGIGRVLDRLEAMGLRERTLVVFSGDNGMSMGHHGIWGKGNGTFPLNMYDSAVKIPFIVSCPGRVPQGQVCSGMYGHLDWLPTVVDYFGVKPVDGLPGRSFAPVLRGENDPGNDAVIICDEYGPTRMVRERDWKLVLRYPDGPNELYHLAADPCERTNLFADPAQADQVARLTRRLTEWFAAQVDPARDGWRQPVTGLGQVDRVERGAEAFVKRPGK